MKLLLFFLSCYFIGSSESNGIEKPKIGGSCSNDSTGQIKFGKISVIKDCDFLVKKMDEITANTKSEQKRMKILANLTKLYKVID